MIKVCPQCLKSFDADRARVVYCSHSCVGLMRAQTGATNMLKKGESRLYLITCRSCGNSDYSYTARTALCDHCKRDRTCKLCGKSIAASPLRRKFCSQSCSAEWRYHNTDIGTHLGWTDPDSAAKKLKGMQGKPRSTRRPRDPNTVTRRDLYQTSENMQWRKKVFERDNYTCQICGKRGGDLHAHHIVGWAVDESKRYEVTNGKTLCVPCHRAVHSI